MQSEVRLKCLCIMSHLLHTEGWFEISTCFLLSPWKNWELVYWTFSFKWEVSAILSVSVMLVPFPFQRYQDYFRSPKHAGDGVSCVILSADLPFLCMLNERRQMLKGQLLLDVKCF